MYIPVLVDKRKNLDRKHTIYAQLYRHQINRAKRRHLKFSLSLEQYKDITSQNCFYCGCEPSNKYLYISNHSPNGEYLIYNGIDRADNTLGYIFENCLPCCFDCNEIKKSRNKNEFLDLIKKIYSHINQ